jgi:hypothetical protein
VNGSLANSAKRLDCDAVAFAHGLRSETQLADLLGCEFSLERAQPRLAAKHVMPAGRSSVKGVYLAGDGAGIMGADAAEMAGELRGAGTCSKTSATSIRRAAPVCNWNSTARIGDFRQGLERAFAFPEDWAAKAPMT